MILKDGRRLVSEESLGAGLTTRLCRVHCHVYAYGYDLGRIFKADYNQLDAYQIECRYSLEKLIRLK